jgi:hypothetical protein
MLEYVGYFMLRLLGFVCAHEILTKHILTRDRALKSEDSYRKIHLLCLNTYTS